MGVLHHRIIDDDQKIVELTFQHESLIFQLNKKRSFTVLIELVKRYPEYMNIHDLDDTFHDPNRALSSLRNEDAFNGYIKREYREKRVTYVKLDAESLFKTVSNTENIIKLWSQDIRKSLPSATQKRVFDSCSGRCNITGIHLQEETAFDSVWFMKNAMTLTFDHRRPLSKGGSNEEHNFQILSKIANNEKNKICNSCRDPKCQMCALAHPEKVRLIHPTKQDISVLRRHS